MERSEISENRKRRYLKELGKQDQEISKRYRKQMMQQRKKQRSRDPFERMFDRNYDPFNDNQEKVDTNEKDW